MIRRRFIKTLGAIGLAPFILVVSARKSPAPEPLADISKTTNAWWRNDGKAAQLSPERLEEAMAEMQRMCTKPGRLIGTWA